MLTKLHDKEADATSVFPRNRVLADTLLKLEKKIIETQKKAGTFTSKKTSCVSADVLPVQNKPDPAVYALFIEADTHI